MTSHLIVCFMGKFIYVSS